MKVVEATLPTYLEGVKTRDTKLKLVLVAINNLNAKHIIINQVKLGALLCFECS